jgi:hypothetical protein
VFGRGLKTRSVGLPAFPGPSDIAIRGMIEQAGGAHVLQLDACVGARAVEVVGEGLAVIDELTASRRGHSAASAVVPGKNTQR